MAAILKRPVITLKNDRDRVDNSYQLSIAILKVLYHFLTASIIHVFRSAQQLVTMAVQGYN